jgi:hypothetical protein
MLYYETMKLYQGGGLMNQQKDLIERIKDLPNWIKGAIGLVGAIIGFIALILGNVYLGITVLVTVVLAAAFCLCVYLAFSKKDSPIMRGRRIYRFSASCRYLSSGGIVLIFVISGILLANSSTRSFAYYAVAGTPTHTPTMTTTFTPTPTDSPTMTATFTPTPTDTPTMTTTFTPTPTPTDAPTMTTTFTPTPTPTDTPTSTATTIPTNTPIPPTATATPCPIEVASVFEDIWDEDEIQSKLGCPQAEPRLPSHSKFAEQPFKNGHLYWSSPKTDEVHCPNGLYFVTFDDEKEWKWYNECEVIPMKETVNTEKGFEAILFTEPIIKLRLGDNKRGEERFDDWDTLQEFRGGYMFQDSDGNTNKYIYVFYSDDMTFEKYFLN